MLMLLLVDGTVVLALVQTNVALSWFVWTSASTTVPSTNKSINMLTIQLILFFDLLNEFVSWCFSPLKSKQTFDIIAVKIIDTFSLTTPFWNRQIEFTLSDLAAAPDIEPRTRTAPKPFEGIELPKSKVTTRKNASTTTKVKPSKPKTVAKSRATIRKPVMKAKGKPVGRPVGKPVEEEVEKEQQVSADGVQVSQNGTSTL
jgi:hypothetical protein